MPTYRGPRWRDLPEKTPFQQTGEQLADQIWDKAVQAGQPPLHIAPGFGGGRANPLRRGRAIVRSQALKGSGMISYEQLCMFFAVLGTIAASMNGFLLYALHVYAKVMSVFCPDLLHNGSKISGRHKYAPLELWFYGFLVATGLLELLRFPRGRRSRTLRHTMYLKEKQFFAKPQAYSLKMRMPILALVL
jgi:hypothetical protein